MYTATSHLRRSEPRKGLILMVVLALLTAFAIVGLSFVLYADSEAKAAMIAREAEQATLTQHPYDYDPHLLLSSFMGQFLFDVSDPTGLSDTTAINSALRGHSLARYMYGYNDQSPASNVIPFNGLGHLQTQVAGLPASFGSPAPSEINMPNYQVFPADGFIRDPERPGVRTTTRNTWLGGFNAPYTAPDLNHPYLAQVDSLGNILQPSFHRSSLFGPLDNPANPNWTNAVGKYMTFRPRPSENPAFPMPEDANGDVKNLVGNPGGNDSIWIDNGFPIRTAADGKRFKALFAPLIMELDSRINLSAHGNIMGQTTDSGGATVPNHISNSGWGPWSVNVGRVLKHPTDPTKDFQWTQLFTGNPQVSLTGRYGADKLPGNGTVRAFPAVDAGIAVAYPLVKAPYYSKFNFDEGVFAGSFRSAAGPVDPIGTIAKAYFPNYPAGGYAVDLGATPSPLSSHPLANNLFAATPITGNDDNGLATADMESLLRFNDTLSYSLTSRLLYLAPDILSQARPRNLITTRAFDVDAPGVSPWLLARSSTGGSYTLAPYTAGATARPVSPAPGAFPVPDDIKKAILGTAPTATPMNDYSGDGRMNYMIPGLTASLAQRLDLNRPLPDYPGVPDTNVQLITDNAWFNAAQSARQQFAKDIFDRLQLITGADMLPTAASTGNPNHDALRWLAQLAVNIVDFIDTDDYMTPFFWNPASTADVVYGVELPRLLINEAYVQFTKATTGGQTHFVEAWVELFNPHNPTGVSANYLTDGGKATLATKTGGMPPITNAYQILLCNKDRAGVIRGNTNTTGNPGDALIIQTGGATSTSSSGSTAIKIGVAPDTTGNAVTVLPNSYWLVGPKPIPISPTDPLTRRVDNTNTAMAYSVDPVGTELPLAPTIVLRRLACPNMPLQTDATLPGFNDYVTVDYFEDACGQSAMNAGNTGFPIVSNNENTNPGRVSYGRIHPYMGNKATTSNVIAQNSGTDQHNLKSDNLPIAPSGSISFPWLVHLDRNLSSPMELLHVAGVRPFELTQSFGDTATAALGLYGHRIPWFDEDLGASASNSHRLYRFFELVETRSRLMGMAPVQYAATFNAPAGGTIDATLPPAFASNGAVVRPAKNDVVVIIDGSGNVMEHIRLPDPLTGNSFRLTVQRDYSGGVPVTIQTTSTGGRIPGKINLNGIQSTDPEILNALCDPPPSGSNRFTQDDVTAIFNNMKTTVLQQSYLGNALGQYTAADPQYPRSGVLRSLFQPSPTTTSGPTLFEPPSQALATNHPFLRYELLNKIYNNTTSRSNVFAVWMTVGFFEVDENGKLGQEIGKAEGKSIRHRMFAIVDRTGLAVPRTLGLTSGAITAAAGAQNVTLASITGGSGSHLSVNLQTQLVVGNQGAANAEIVTVTGSANGVISAVFTQSHAANEPVYIMPGNWGPQPGFDVTQPVNSQIVPYYNIIE